MTVSFLVQNESFLTHFGPNLARPGEADFAALAEAPEGPRRDQKRPFRPFSDPAAKMVWLTNGRFWAFNPRFGVSRPGTGHFDRF